MPDINRTHAVERPAPVNLGIEITLPGQRQTPNVWQIPLASLKGLSRSVGGLLADFQPPLLVKLSQSTFYRHTLLDKKRFDFGNSLCQTRPEARSHAVLWADMNRFDMT